jgi:hypothetical protein
MTATISLIDSQREFYRRWLMGRRAFDLTVYGVEMDRDAFMDLMVDEFNGTYQGEGFDELLLRPREALAFCDAVRFKHRQFRDVPEEVILRSIMIRRKNP